VNIGKLVVTKRIEFGVLGILMVDSAETSKGVSAVHINVHGKGSAESRGKSGGD